MAILKFTSGSTHTCYSRLCKYLASVSSPSCLLLLTWAFDCFEGLSIHAPPPPALSLDAHPRGLFLLCSFQRSLIYSRTHTPDRSPGLMPQRGRRVLQYPSPIQAQGECQPYPLRTTGRQNGYHFISNLSSGGVETNQQARRQAPWSRGEERPLTLASQATWGLRGGSMWGQ